MKCLAYRHSAVRVCQLAICCCHLMGCLAISSAAGPDQPAANQPTHNQPEQSKAEQLVQQAVDAGLQGDLQNRTALLEDAIKIAPNYAPARWEAGQISIDGAWLPLSEAQAQAAKDPRLEQYHSARQAAANNPIGHLQLARWCRKNRLADEARYHWLAVLVADPQNREALKALDSRWHGGQLVSKELAEELKDAQRKQRKANQTWRIRIAKWERALSGDEAEASAAIEQLRKVVDTSAITEFEKLAAKEQRGSEAALQRRQLLVLAFIDSLHEMPELPATESLCRFALFAPDKPQRAAAAEALPQRPRYEVMPLLLSRLASPIESHFYLTKGASGHVSYSHEFFTKGPTADQVFEQTDNTYFNVVALRPTRDRVDLRATANRIARAEGGALMKSNLKLQHYQREAYRVEQQVRAENARRLAVNDRIVGILRQVTGEELGYDPIAWWDYWQDYNEYSRPPYRPTNYRRQDYCQHDTNYLDPQYRRPRAMSCFVAGTPVWTKTGLTPIETISAGDLVLSQDLATGEYSYRPIITTTKRDPSATLKISAGGETIQTTLGHPFWLPKVGWRMAKELDAGDKLLAVDNPVEIERIAEGDDEVAFNLVVEGPGNYFVGSDGLLVHDNTPRRAGSARLAGR